jgi:hypothetical protein
MTTKPESKPGALALPLRISEHTKCIVYDATDQALFAVIADHVARNAAAYSLMLAVNESEHYRNEARALMARCEALEGALESIRVTLDGWVDGARIGALSAEQRGDDDEQVAQSNTRENYQKLVNIAARALLAGKGE